MAYVCALQLPAPVNQGVRLLLTAPWITTYEQFTMPPLMAVGFMIFGLVFLLAFISDFRATLRNNRYLKTQGILKKSSVEKHGELNSNRQFFSPMVVYEYTVGGKKYVGKQLTVPARSKRTQIEAEEALYPYVQGAPLVVWYDPDAPQHCYLKKASPFEASLPVIFGGVLLAIGGIGLIYTLS